ncbi:MAG: hypothetical protein HUN04_11420 [Desulfobacter sp.]|nr:MAG: hypothetical protein HUN04_11420 [Desulfobacter sp.]
MPANPVIIFGAGATKACNGPLTWEILPQAFELESELKREDFFGILDDFLIENFHLPANIEARQASDYPGLPLLISLLDTAIDHGDNFSADWPLARLVEVRNALEYVIFALLEHQLRHIGRNYYKRLLVDLYHKNRSIPRIISLNYDIIADNSLIYLSQMASDSLRFPDYGCDVATATYKKVGKMGALLKLHGSLNWLYCPACHRLDVGISKSGRGMVKMLEALYIEEADSDFHLEKRYSCHGSPCRDCGAFVRPVMITPTHMKDYRNPHISQVWYRAARELRRADHAYIIGYSMPEDDVDVIYLLKRGLSHLPAQCITVVDYDDRERPARQHPAGGRYCTLFGEDIDWHPEGFSAWIDSGPFN